MSGAAVLSSHQARPCAMNAGRMQTVRPSVRSFVPSPVLIKRAAVSSPSRVLAVDATATAAPAQQKIRIKLKSYWVDLLQESVEKIKDAAATTGASIAGPVPLPTR